MAGHARQKFGEPKGDIVYLFMVRDDTVMERHHFDAFDRSKINTPPGTWR